MKLIATDGDLAEAAAALTRADPALAPALRDALPMRRRAEGFGTLRDLIVSQMISVAAARAISARLDAAGLCEAGDFAAASDMVLRGAGLSAAKARALQAIARSGFDYAALPGLPDDEVTRRLTALPGIGRWSADIYLMFALGRADAFAPGDLALAEAVRMIDGLSMRPGPAALAERAERWRPWRAVAARALWAYYGREKGREGVPA